MSQVAIPSLVSRIKQQAYNQIKTYLDDLENFSPRDIAKTIWKHGERESVVLCTEQADKWDIHVGNDCHGWSC